MDTVVVTVSMTTKEECMSIEVIGNDTKTRFLNLTCINPLNIYPDAILDHVNCCYVPGHKMLQFKTNRSDFPHPNFRVGLKEELIDGIPITKDIIWHCDRLPSSLELKDYDIIIVDLDYAKACVATYGRTNQLYVPIDPVVNMEDRVVLGYRGLKMF